MVPTEKLGITPLCASFVVSLCIAAAAQTYHPLSLFYLRLVSAGIDAVVSAALISKRIRGRNLVDGGNHVVQRGGWGVGTGGCLTCNWSCGPDGIWCLGTNQMMACDVSNGIVSGLDRLPANADVYAGNREYHGYCVSYVGAATQRRR